MRTWWQRPRHLQKFQKVDVFSSGLAFKKISAGAPSKKETLTVLPLNLETPESKLILCDSPSLVTQDEIHLAKLIYDRTVLD
mmetsp:Transcript_3804/g.3721  ORF Transcript_3804/g.3721 Transcript_3804/m.3721 type:complete len:82 (+) Transcript_3804:1763-2008(+)